jgi:cytochrome c oxidase cbb3-type subunit I/II
MLIAPSWGGMINGLLTLRSAWDKVRESAVLKFLVVAVTAYGMATFEGPMLSLKNVNAIAHFTDWIISHVHIGALGWNGFMIFGILYWLIPRLYKTELFSKKLANYHFWIGFLGIVFYAIPMYWSGITQSLMWKQFTPDGLLEYPNFLQTVLQIKHMYIIRAVGGLLYLIGVIMMIYNLVKTVKAGKFVPNEETEAPALSKDVDIKVKGGKHRWVESRPVKFALIAIVVVLVGGLVEMIPTFVIKSNIPTIPDVKPYTPLEVQGRDIYIREGCLGCHSQLVRPFRSETERYGEYSKAGEYVYDHPFTWGSKRTGPDLHRIGGKYNNMWHYLHMEDPGSVSPNSIMPKYPWLITQELNINSTQSKINALRKIGVPYPDGYEKQAEDDLIKQAETIAADLQKQGIAVPLDREIIALIAYLQRLGTDIKVKNK